MTEYVVKRIHDDPEATDGLRVLVDRLWPRGIAKERAALDDWAKDLAPSPELRIWFDHRADRLEEFSARYRGELDARPEAAGRVAQWSSLGRVTLLYAAKDPVVNHAVVLRDWLVEAASDRPADPT
ncbi:DUF488 domain-containing protein [Raineyella sp. LH-20]|uniref:DUF488 domain-containing protein n=1 Tax=Raineyella sp. LH-20 TaxID=3081204 RepID=UPI0029554749|nr:DUF488 family protein [Raineyella sp. LH-20]WOP17532.1 DUF488 family protein [Raineyella sp. LH-20]